MNKGTTTLSLYPSMHGLCYTVFAGRLIILDWGIKTVHRDTSATEHAVRLIEMFSPATVLLPARKRVNKGSGRLLQIGIDILAHAVKLDIETHLYSRADVQAYFAQYGAKSKDDIARVIVTLFPEFGQHLPPRRRVWMSEDYRMGLFDAVALAVVHFGQDKA